MPLPRSLAEVLGRHGDALKNDLRKVIPATVVAVYPARQTVDVQIAVNNPLFDDLGNVITEPAPSISDVPLGVVRGGGFLVWVPVAIGDSVLLVFSDLSTDTWRLGDGTPQDPGWVGKHTLDSPFAIPMIAPDAHFLASPAAAAGKLVIGKDGGAAQIRISATDIELGAVATDAIALASKVDAIITALRTWTVVAGDGGAALKAAVIATGVTTSASTLVKAQ
jgi:hypothetical protein